MYTLQKKIQRIQPFIVDQYFHISPLIDASLLILPPRCGIYFRLATLRQNVKRVYNISQEFDINGS
jgi:hypothetical protein